MARVRLQHTVDELGAKPPKISSQKQSLVMLHGLFDWLLSTGYTTVVSVQFSHLE